MPTDMDIDEAQCTRFTAYDLHVITSPLQQTIWGLLYYILTDNKHPHYFHKKFRF